MRALVMTSVVLRRVRNCRRIIIFYYYYYHYYYMTDTDLKVDTCDDAVDGLRA